MASFLEEKRALGWGYHRQALTLKRLDRYLVAVGHATEDLPRQLVEDWTSAQSVERPANQAHRVNVVRQFAGYLRRRGVTAYVPPEGRGPIRCDQYVPYVFTREQIGDLLCAADRIKPEGHSPHRYRIMPLIFRLLYGCGLRVNEALLLRVRDVDIDLGVLTIQEGKFRKDRLVPVADTLRRRLVGYAEDLPLKDAGAPFFPSPNRRPYAKATVYGVFRGLLFACGIAHGGRGRGPRLHDLRHTFAVHCLERWYREGADLNAKLPHLSAYMGHRGLSGTTRYLRLTPYVFPDIASGMEAFTGHALPRRSEP
jgi:integrase